MTIDRSFVLRDDALASKLYAFLKANWRSMAAAGKPIEVVVREYKAKRSTAQNSRYWALLREIADQAWVDGKQFSKEQWHAEFAGRFIGWEETPGGRAIPISTSSLDTTEFSAYMDRIDVFAATELGVELGAMA